MPGFDGTGPEGRGPRTGRQMGNCTGARGFGFCGRGLRMGRGWRNVEPLELTKEQKIKILKEEQEAIEKELKELE